MDETWQKVLPMSSHREVNHGRPWKQSQTYSPMCKFETQNIYTWYCMAPVVALSSACLKHVQQNHLERLWRTKRCTVGRNGMGRLYRNKLFCKNIAVKYDESKQTKKLRICQFGTIWQWLMVTFRGLLTVIVTNSITEKINSNELIIFI